MFTAGAVYSQQESMQLSAGAEGAETSDFSDTALYPPTKPIQSGKIKVSDVHTLAFTVYGNPNGKPVLFVHGGPGVVRPRPWPDYFNPEKYKVVLVDQRGCGESTPFAKFGGQYHLG